MATEEGRGGGIQDCFSLTLSLTMNRLFHELMVAELGGECLRVPQTVFLNELW